MRFSVRLVFGTVVVLAITMALLLWMSERRVRRDLETTIARALEREAHLVHATLPSDPARWGQAVDRLARNARYRITLLGPDGRILADSEIPSVRLDREPPRRDRPEIVAAASGQVGMDVRRGELDSIPTLYLAIPSSPVVRLGESLGGVAEAVASAQRSVLIAALVALLIGIGLSLVAGRSISRPLTALSAAAQDIARGAPPRLPHSGIPEIDTLIEAFRRMHGRIAEHFAELSAERGGSEALVDAMGEGVLACDARGRVVRANPAARRLLGYPTEGPLPGLPTLFHSKAAREVVDAALQGETLSNREFPLDDRILLASARAMPDGGTVMVLHDVTALRRLEAIRRDFVANVSHELKTPLTSIAGYSETLLANEVDPATSRQFLERIHGNAQRMQALVDDLLDLARLESGRFRPEPEDLDLTATIGEAWAGFQEMAGAREVTLKVQLAPAAGHLTADPESVRQILTNLLSNALRYTPARGTITCRAIPEDDGIAVQVTDTGSGIPGDHLPRIFERFYRVDPSRARAGGGTGLGLAIVKHLTEAHGGRVRAESGVGRGTTITCWFPLHPRTELPAEPEDPVTSA